MMSDLLSAISVLLVFIVMFNEVLTESLNKVINNKPSKDQENEFKKYQDNLKDKRIKLLGLSIFELIVIGTVTYSLIDTFNGVSPIFVISLLILLSMILLFSNSLNNFLKSNKLIK